MLDAQELNLDDSEVKFQEDSFCSDNTILYTTKPKKEKSDFEKLIDERYCALRNLVKVGDTLGTIKFSKSIEDVEPKNDTEFFALEVLKGDAKATVARWMGDLPLYEKSFSHYQSALNIADDIDSELRDSYVAYTYSRLGKGNIRYGMLKANAGIIREGINYLASPEAFIKFAKSEESDFFLHQRATIKSSKAEAKVFLNEIEKGGEVKDSTVELMREALKYTRGKNKRLYRRVRLAFVLISQLNSRYFYKDAPVNKNIELDRDFLEASSLVFDTASAVLKEWNEKKSIPFGFGKLIRRLIWCLGSLKSITNKSKMRGIDLTPLLDRLIAESPLDEKSYAEHYFLDLATQFVEMAQSVYSDTLHSENLAVIEGNLGMFFIAGGFSDHALFQFEKVSRIYRNSASCSKLHFYNIVLKFISDLKGELTPSSKLAYPEKNEAIETGNSEIESGDENKELTSEFSNSATDSSAMELWKELAPQGTNSNRRDFIKLLDEVRLKQKEYSKSRKQKVRYNPPEGLLAFRDYLNDVLRAQEWVVCVPDRGTAKKFILINDYLTLSISEGGTLMLQSLEGSIRIEGSRPDAEPTP